MNQTGLNAFYKHDLTFPSKQTMENIACGLRGRITAKPMKNMFAHKDYA